MRCIIGNVSWTLVQLFQKRIIITKLFDQKVFLVRTKTSWSWFLRCILVLKLILMIHFISFLHRCDQAFVNCNIIFFNNSITMFWIPWKLSSIAKCINFKNIVSLEIHENIHCNNYVMLFLFEFLLQK